MKRNNSVSIFLPHNFLAEKMIIQCLILDNSTVELTLRTLSKKAFFFKNHELLFKVICLMYEKNLIINFITLRHFIQSNGLVAKIGGLQILSELNQNVPNIIYLEQYIDLVNEKFFRRSLINFCYDLLYLASATNMPIQDLIDKAEIELFQILNPLNNQNIISSSQLLNIVFKDITDKFLNPHFSGLRSGFQDFDNLTQGFQKSDLIILAGRPSMGKTAFSLNLTLNILKTSNLPVLFFTIEMSQIQIIYRLLTLETNISSQKLKMGELFTNDWIKLNKIFKIFCKLPLFINDTPNLSLQDIYASIKKLHVDQKQIGLVIIDYLQLIQGSNRQNMNRTQQLSEITKSLKVLAREFNVPILALSQLSRNVENRLDQRPILSDLRESGSIEQDADLVLMLFRDQVKLSNQLHNNSNNKLIDLIISKHRNGPLGKVQFNFEEERMRFSKVYKVY